MQNQEDTQSGCGEEEHPVVTTARERLKSYKPLFFGPWAAHRYKVGDDAWIYCGNHQGEMTKGRVVHVFSLPGWAIPEHYVVEIETEIDPLLEVRDPMCMRPSEPQPERVSGGTESNTDAAQEHDWRAPKPGEPMEEGGVCRRCGRYATSEGHEPCRVMEPDRFRGDAPPGDP